MDRYKSYPLAEWDTTWFEWIHKTLVRRRHLQKQVAGEGSLQ